MTGSNYDRLPHAFLRPLYLDRNSEAAAITIGVRESLEMEASGSKARGNRESRACKCKAAMDALPPAPPLQAPPIHSEGRCFNIPCMSVDVAKLASLNGLFSLSPDGYPQMNIGRERKSQEAGPYQTVGEGEAGGTGEGEGGAECGGGVFVV